jgi:nucleoside-diphosphate-sugar epimerase
MNKIIITGAAGFIGSNVAAYFCEKGIDIICIVKKTTSLKNLRNLPVKIIYGDITEIKTLQAAFINIGCVIHIAALARDWGKYEEFYKVNVNGTLNVLNASHHNGVKNVIITGSISNYGEENSQEVKNEECPFNSHYNYFLDELFPCKMNYYRDTKALATKEAIKYSTINEMNLTIIEPVWVFGEHEFNTGFYEYMKAVKKGISFFPGSNKNKFHVIYVRDLARAYFLAYKKKLTGINRILVGNKKTESMNKIYSIFCRELGVKKPINIPKSLIYPLGFIMEFIYTICSIKHAPMLTRGRVNMFYDNIEYSVMKAEKVLSFVNEYTLEEGIKRTVNWYKDNNLI